MRIFLLFFLLSSATLFAQQAPPEVQKPLVTKVTATWCPPCGGWGWDLFENLIEDNEDSAILIAGHYSRSDLETVAGNEIADNFAVRGQPSFFLGNAQQSASSSSSATARTNIKAAIAAEVTTAPIANATIVYTAVQDRAYTFETTTQFFQAADGEYSLAVYAVEDDVVNRQTSRSADAIHKRVLRGGIQSQNTFGELVVNGAVAANAMYTSTFTFDFPADWNIDNIRLVTILWKNDGASFEYVNGNEIKSGNWVNVSSTNNRLAAEDYRISGFGESGILTTTLELANEVQNASVELIDANGRLLATRQLGLIPSGKTQLTWDEVSLATGIYAVRLTIGGRSRSGAILMP